MTGAVVLDIEGTTSSAAHVHEVLFPYARARLAGWIAAHRADPEVQRALTEVSRYLGSDTVADETAAVRTLQKWSDEDRKAGPLKKLQGMIWSEGYQRKELTGHVYPDTVEALDTWRERGTGIHIYSSGSVQAQQQWFRHSPYGDLRGRLTHYFDTSNAGPKTAAASYRTIAAALALPPSDLLFASDTPAELDAARAAGWRTGWIVRTTEKRHGAAPATDHPTYPDLASVAHEEAP
ncbi:acireductone synthase [Streptomyces sp. NPDC058000]|uniref:acireductone synthase n=1 Tax=Streptomyces sp. NPDC058000 TaxID=3346299 RepID=UPI0036E3D9C7